MWLRYVLHDSKQIQSKKGTRTEDTIHFYMQRDVQNRILWKIHPTYWVKLKLIILNGFGVLK